jgi:hypothetical protein
MRTILGRFIIALLILVSCALCLRVMAQDERAETIYRGPYLGLPSPGATPQVFAPGFICDGIATRDVAMTPDGNEIYVSKYLGRYTYTAIFVTRQVNGVWTEPEVAPFSGGTGWIDVEPCISPDGTKFFFLSTRPDAAKGTPAGNQDIWVMDRVGDGWGEPYNLGGPVNTEAGEFYPSLTRDGTLYFTRTVGQDTSIWRARLVGGTYAEPEKLPAEVNGGRVQYNAFVAPDESYIITCIFGREDSLGGTDYYISYRDAADHWVGPINLGAPINTPGNEEFAPYVSRDGTYFFFMASRILPAEELPGGRLSRAAFTGMHTGPINGNSAIWWVEASFIEALKPR